MQFIHKFTSQNASHQQIYIRQCVLSTNLLQKKQVIDKFITENISQR